MVARTVLMSRGTHWAWWLAIILLAAAIVIDLVDGAPLKLATSGLLFAACLLAATSRPPRPKPLGFAIIACIAGAVGLVLYRIFGPGL